jgi:hypothetical protein
MELYRIPRQIMNCIPKEVLSLDARNYCEYINVLNRRTEEPICPKPAAVADDDNDYGHFLN